MNNSADTAPAHVHAAMVRTIAATTVVVGILAMILSAKYQIETRPTLGSAGLRLLTFFTFWSDVVITGGALCILLGRGPMLGRVWLTRGLLAAMLTALSYTLFQGWSHIFEDGVRNMLGHAALPLLVTAMWFLRPSPEPLRWQDLPLLPAYTLVYIAVVFVAGHLFRYYPYDMLNIYARGYRHFFMVVIATTIGHWVIGAGLIVFDQWWCGRRAPGAHPGAVPGAPRRAL